MITEEARGFALADSERLGVIFRELGVGGEGAIPRLYDVARSMWEGGLQDRATFESLAIMLHGGLLDIANRYLPAATRHGVNSAARQLAALGLFRLVPPAFSFGMDVLRESALSALDSQLAGARASLFLNMDPVLIFGDDSRRGWLRPGPILQEVSFWVASSWWASFSWAIRRAGVAAWNKVAIAALDVRTTETCRLVDGQEQPLDRPFHLTGEPRFADDIMFPPFHGYCRTAVALAAPG